MHFGRLASLDGVDLGLPDDSLRTKRFLALDHRTVTQIYAGCPVWACRQWVGTFYPSGTKSGDYLRNYAKMFNTVEVNSTFYHLLDAQRIAQWRDEVTSGFRFCPKVYRGITEGLAAPTMPGLIARFCASVSAFDDKLGLAFAQLPETFGPQHGTLLVKLLQHWPKSVPLAIEFRHPGWFKQHALLDEVVNLLYRHNVATVITDTPGRRDVLHLSLTQPRVMIRFQGHSLHPSDQERLARWAVRIEQWMRHNLEAIYLFTHQPEESIIPETARLFTMELAQRLPEFAATARAAAEPPDLFSRLEGPESRC